MGLTDFLTHTLTYKDIPTCRPWKPFQDNYEVGDLSLVVRRFSSSGLRSLEDEVITDANANVAEVRPVRKATPPLPPVRKESLPRGQESHLNGHMVTSSQVKAATNGRASPAVQEHFVSSLNGIILSSSSQDPGFEASMEVEKEHHITGSKVAFTESVEYTEKVVNANLDEGIDKCLSNLGLEEINGRGKSASLSSFLSFACKILTKPDFSCLPSYNFIIAFFY